MKKLILIAIIFPVIAGLGFSQSFGEWESPQSIATQGIYPSDADSFIMPNSFSDVDFYGFYAVTSFASSKLFLGAATKFNDMYLAAAYSGTLWGGYTDFPFTESKSDWINGGEKTVPTYTRTTFDTGTPNNNIAFLLGLENMGFRFTYSTTHQSFSEEDFIAGTLKYKSYQTASGDITPQLAFALTKDLMPAGIRPWATLDLGFHRDYARYETYDSDGYDDAGKPKHTTKGEQISKSENYFEPRLTLGLGGYTFYENQSGFSASADFEYSIALKSYSNDYSYAYTDESTSKVTYRTSTISGLNGGPSSLSEDSYVENIFTPSVSAGWSDDRIALGLCLSLPVALINESSTDMGLYKYSLRKSADSSSTTIEFAPELALAAQWKILSNLTLNAGGSIGALAVSRTSTAKTGYTYDADDKVTTASSEGVSKDFGTTFTSLSAGVTFNVTNNMAFEATMGTQSDGISVFNWTGFFTFAKLLVSLRF
jgi:hypothetical protein